MRAPSDLKSLTSTPAARANEKPQLAACSLKMVGVEVLVALNWNVAAPLGGEELVLQRTRYPAGGIDSGQPEPPNVSLCAAPKPLASLTTMSAIETLCCNVLRSSIPDDDTRKAHRARKKREEVVIVFT